MKKIPSILLAAISGVAIESALCVISVVSVLAGGIGPCGPTGDVPVLVRVIHQPGFLLSGFLVEDSDPLYLPLAVAVTTVLLSILTFIVLRFGIGRNEIDRPPTALEPTAAATSVSGAPSNSKAGGDFTSTSGGGGSTLAHFATMATMNVYGFAHEDLLAARRAVEAALSFSLEEAEESTSPGGCYYRCQIPDGPCVQLRRNSGSYQRWQGDLSHPWHPDYGILVFVHGPAQESIAHSLQHDVNGLTFLETRETM